MLTPGLAELLKPFVVGGAATHSVKILRNKGMVAVRQRKPIHVYRPLVAGIGSQRDPHAAIDCTIGQLNQVEQIADDNVRARHSSGQRNIKRGQCLGFHIAVCVELCDIDRLHVRSNGNTANQRTGI